MKRLLILSALVTWKVFVFAALLALISSAVYFIATLSLWSFKVNTAISNQSKSITEIKTKQENTRVEILDLISKEVEHPKNVEDSKLKQENIEERLAELNNKVNEICKTENGETDCALVYLGIQDISILLYDSYVRSIKIERRNNAVDHLRNSTGIYLAPIAELESSGLLSSGKLVVARGFGFLISDEYFLTVKHVVLPPLDIDLVADTTTTAVFDVLGISITFKNPVYSKDDLLALYKLDKNDAEIVKKLGIYYPVFASSDIIKSSSIAFRLAPPSRRTSMNSASFGVVTGIEDNFVITCCEDAYVGDSGSPLLVYNELTNRLEIAGITELIFGIDYGRQQTSSTSSGKILEFLNEQGVVLGQ